MADKIEIQTEIKAGFLPSIHADLLQIFPLQPPPTVRGKYILAKYAQAVANELPTFQQQKMDLLKKHAEKDEKGDPILLQVPGANGQVAVSIPSDWLAKNPDVQMAFNKDDAELFNTPIKLNLPMLTHAELGECPIPQGVYTRLLGVLIRDEMPEGV